MDLLVTKNPVLLTKVDPDREDSPAGLTYALLVQSLVLFCDLLVPSSTLVSSASCSQFHVDRSLIEQRLVEVQCFLLCQ